MKEALAERAFLFYESIAAICVYSKRACGTVLVVTVILAESGSGKGKKVVNHCLCQSRPCIPYHTHTPWMTVPWGNKKYWSQV